MKLTTAEEYGLRCLLQVARLAPYGSGKLASIRDVADAEGLSADYVAKLLGRLRKAELLHSTRGASGGYALARGTDEITAAQALSAFDTPVHGDGFCTSFKGQLDCCVHKTQATCNLTSLWTAVGTALNDVLSRVTLSDLLADSAAPPRAAAGGTHG